VKRRIVLKSLERLARVHGVAFRLERSTGPHDVFRWGDRLISIPRHREVNERLARSILREVQRWAEGI
jgi:mRNA interferase HicA